MNLGPPKEPGKQAYRSWIGAGPSLNLALLRVVPAVRDDAVPADRLAGEHARLHGARQGGQDRLEAPQEAALEEGIEARRVRTEKG